MIIYKGKAKHYDMCAFRKAIAKEFGIIVSREITIAEIDSLITDKKTRLNLVVKKLNQFGNQLEWRFKWRKYD